MGSSFGDIVPAALVQAPAVWVVVGLAALAWAWRSTWTGLAWGLLGLFVTLGQIGELIGLPDVVLAASPYSHVPAMPVEDFDPGATAGLLAVTAVLLGASWWRYRRRDIG